MEQFDLIIKARRAITPEGERALSIGIQGGRIIAINDFNTAATASRRHYRRRRRGPHAGSR